MIKKCDDNDFNDIYIIINDVSAAYKGIIPKDRWHEPYMSVDELKGQIDKGVEFWGYYSDNVLTGVMGIQDRGDVCLIRHAYVRTVMRGQGIGGKLLTYMIMKTDLPVLIGTWAAAVWAIGFYKKYGFKMVDDAAKDMLLKKYWSIPQRQIETSVVLADEKWLSENL